MKSVKVLDVFKLSNGDSILVCNARDMLGFNGTIKTSVGTFSPGQYEIVEGTVCFTDQPPCCVRLKTTADCAGIEEIYFE